MFYWKRNVGEEAVLQQGMSFAEIGILTLLEDHLITAGSITDDWIANRFRIASESLANRSRIASESAEAQAVLRVLNLAFVRCEGGWTREDLANQIDAFKARSCINKKNASSSESQANRKRIASKPITDNRNTPPSGETRARATAPRKQFVPEEVGLSVTEQEWQDFLAVRKAKRAPLTETAWARLKREAELANITLSEALSLCVSKGWTSIDHNWESLKKAHTPTPDEIGRMWVEAAERSAAKRAKEKENTYV